MCRLLVVLDLVLVAFVVHFGWVTIIVCSGSRGVRTVSIVVSMISAVAVAVLFVVVELTGGL